MAAHRAFIAAASCARRSGERFSFLLGFFAPAGFFAPVAGSVDFFPAEAVARAADFLAAFNALADCASCNLRLSLASFWGPSRRRFSSCWIFFFNFFDFMIVLLFAPKANSTIGFRVNDKISPMSRSSLARCLFGRPDDGMPHRRADESTPSRQVRTIARWFC